MKQYSTFKKNKTGASPQHFIIDYVIYPFDLLVSICESDDTVRNVLKDKLPEDIHGEIDIVFKESEARAVCFPNGATIIRFKNKPSAGLIAHEAFHAVEYIMNILELPVSEAWAYLLQYIVNEITYKINEKQ